MAPTELLMRRDPGSIIRLPALQHRNAGTPTPTARFTRPEGMIAVHCSGQDFLARARMASIFLRRALDIVAHGDSGMVPLLHSTGLELLLITPTTAASCVYDGRTLTDINTSWGAEVRQVLDDEVPAR